MPSVDIKNIVICILCKFDVKDERCEICSVKHCRRQLARKGGFNGM